MARSSGPPLDSVRRDEAGVKLNPDWQYEKIAYFLKPAAGGTCPVFWTRVFRMYNNGMTGAPNHRFTTDKSIYVDFSGRLQRAQIDNQ